MSENTRLIKRARQAQKGRARGCWVGRGRVPPPPRLTVDCLGMAFEELLNAVCAAVGPEAEDLAVQVIEEADRTALEPEIDFRTSEPYRYDDGEVVCKVHAFDSWLAGLANGFF